MRSFRNRGSAPTEIGRVHVLLGTDDCAYVRTTEVADVSYGPLVAMGAVAWAVRTTLTTSDWDRAEVAAFLALACAAEDAGSFNDASGLRDAGWHAPPAGTRGPTASVTLARTAERRLDTAWRVPPECDSVSASTRAFGALWHVATEHGAEEVVRHALFTLRGGFEQNGAFAPEVAADLMAPLLAFSLDMAATESRARTARRGFRVVR
jgi:hypothetical protein